MKKIFTDHGDYIELNEPIGGIKMIAKNPPRTDRGERPDFNPNQNRLGGFTNWQLPKRTDCSVIHKIIEANGNVLNFESYRVELYESHHAIFDMKTGDTIDFCWPKDLDSCWVVLVTE